MTSISVSISGVAWGKNSDAGDVYGGDIQIWKARIKIADLGSHVLPKRKRTTLILNYPVSVLFYYYYSEHN